MGDRQSSESSVLSTESLSTLASVCTGEQDALPSPSTTAAPPLDRPTFLDAPAPACPVCDHSATRRIHFPEYPEPFAHCPSWPAHEKFYCHACVFLWSDRFHGASLADIGREYVKCNTDAQRRPNERMRASPRLLDHLLAWTDGRRFLEYGVGYNTPYIDEVRELGLDLWGCDVSEAVPYSSHVLKLPSAMTKLQKSPFDGVFSQDVVEHFGAPIEDHVRLRSLLRPGGMILSSTPVLERVWNGRSPIRRHIWLWTPWHTAVYSTQSMAIIARRAGLEFVATVPLPTDTQWGFVLRRPDASAGGFNLAREGSPSTLRLRYVLRQYIAQRNWPGAGASTPTSTDPTPPLSVNQSASSPVSDKSSFESAART